jgi:hypothetical protein
MGYYDKPFKKSFLCMGDGHGNTGFLRHIMFCADGHSELLLPVPTHDVSRKYAHARFLVGKPRKHGINRKKNRANG